MDEKFEIRDKRRVDVEGNVKEKAAPEEQKTEAMEKEKKAPAGEKREAQPEQAKREARTEELFMQFLMNLSAMAYMALGLGEVATKPNLPEAKYIIDVLGILEKKTEGNLSREEEQALKGLLYELRMNFSKVAAGGHAAGPGGQGLKSHPKSV
jgi:hypothetical protein